MLPASGLEPKIVHATSFWSVPVTLAVNCRLWPAATTPELGETETVIAFLSTNGTIVGAWFCPQSNAKAACNSTSASNQRPLPDFIVGLRPHSRGTENLVCGPLNNSNRRSLIGERHNVKKLFGGCRELVLGRDYSLHRSIFRWTRSPSPRGTEPSSFNTP